MISSPNETQNGLMQPPKVKEPVKTPVRCRLLTDIFGWFLSHRETRGATCAFNLSENSVYDDVINRTD